MTSLDVGMARLRSVAIHVSDRWGRFNAWYTTRHAIAILDPNKEVATRRTSKRRDIGEEFPLRRIVLADVPPCYVRTDGP